MSCLNCGGPLPADARFCPHCAAPPRGFPASEGGAGGRHEEECEIAWWRGYVKSEFYAVTERGAGGPPHAVARSPAFTWWRGEIPDRERPRVKEAHDALVQRLREEGWEPVGQPKRWYAQRFVRRRQRLHALGSAADEAEEVRAG